jgi:hypothetical protein
MATIRQAKKILTALQEGQYSAGLFCRFIPVSSTHGVKLYEIKNVRDSAYAMQKYAAQHDLAPQVRWKFTSERLGSHRFGFVTETAHELIEGRDGIDWQAFAARLAKAGFIRDGWPPKESRNYAWSPRSELWVLDFGGFFIAASLPELHNQPTDGHE